SGSGDCVCYNFPLDKSGFMSYTRRTLTKLGVAMTDRRRRRARRRARASHDENLAARAVGLGITDLRVLQECASIAFSRITDIIGWDEGKLTLTASEKLSDAQVAAIAEVVASAAN